MKNKRIILISIIVIVILVLISATTIAVKSNLKYLKRMSIRENKVIYETVVDERESYLDEGKEILFLNEKSHDKPIVNYFYKVYIYKDLNILFEYKENIFNLKEALINKSITIEEVIQQAEKDEEEGKIRTSITMDGGSKDYVYGNFFITKMHSLDGNRDVYIAPLKKGTENEKDNYENVLNNSYSVYFKKDEDVKIEYKGEEINLRESLMYKGIEIEEIIQQAEKDEEEGKIRTSISTNGESKQYIYDNFTILKMQTLDGNKNVYIK